VLRTPRRDNADSLADALNQAGHSTAWQRYSHSKTQIRGALAAIWDGGQLNDAETADLEMFCTLMARDGAPVVVLLDFPRRDRVDRAYEVGATAVVGRPFLNCDLLETIDAVTGISRYLEAA
jgi:DNA-binding NarL/FixJ family response regulator